MSERTKIVALILSAALVGLMVWVFFSPYQSCVRDSEAGGNSSDVAAMICREAH